MTTNTRFYTSSDASAPQVSATQGSYAAVLRACLVGTSGTAYGSKASAGWTEPFTASGNIAVFKNSTAAGGTGCYVQIDETTTNTSNYLGLVKVTTYRTMTSLTVGSDPTNTYYAFRTPYQYAGVAPKWHICADEITFYFGVSQQLRTAPPYSVYSTFLGAGDITSFSGSDAYRYFTWSTTSKTSTENGVYSSMTGNNTQILSSNPDIGLSLGRDFTGTVSGYSLHNLLGIGAGANYVGSPSFPASPSLNGANNFSLPQVFVARGNVIRGALRGVAFPIKQAAISYDAALGHAAYNENATETGYVSGGTYSVFSFNQSNSVLAAFFVESVLPWV